MLEEAKALWAVVPLMMMMMKIKGCKGVGNVTHTEITRKRTVTFSLET
jgi:hypothetical protein